MKTKEKILITAKNLFNEHGVENTSAKNIAAAINISDGNLRYYFRTKEDIIYALYLQMVDIFDQQLDMGQKQAVALKVIYDTLAFVFEKLLEYRFLMTDFVVIMRKYPRIKTHYQQLYRQRTQQYQVFINALITEDIFRKDITIAQYQHMIEHLTILSDFWISSAEILYQGDEKEKAVYYTNLVFNLLVPYFSRKGMYEYISLTDNSL